MWLWITHLAWVCLRSRQIKHLFLSSEESNTTADKDAHEHLTSDLTFSTVTFPEVVFLRSILYSVAYCR